MFILLCIGIVIWFLLRFVLSGFYTVDQNERAVRLNFGRAERLPGVTTESDPIIELLSDEERKRYVYPQVRVIPPGGPYFKFPWQRIVKVSIATQTVSIGYDPDNPSANARGEILEAVTKDQLNTGLRGQLQFRVSERNLYAYLFAIENPVAHVMGYFVSILRERIAIFSAPRKEGMSESDLALASAEGVSINDLRKNLSDLNQHMERECRSSVARYGIALEATLITGIDPPHEVESALAAINTAHNQVSSEISLARAAADQKIVQSRRAVEIETMRAQAEVQLLERLAEELRALKKSSADAMFGYIRNVRLALFDKADRAILEAKS